ncbi:5-formyltetrahydrofolate cyclo-ligase [uncultured Jatrophihabitans sp.]|uniref:5-formyltetrahydrofolate cyclo-ligase n=1 Tax=uncultured Jatrophihabitans sp. TaxID=1610747 RepID=UPI0035CB7CB3
MAQTKDELRARLLAARRARSAPAVAAERAALCAHVLARVAARGDRCVAGYEPFRTEPGSVELLAGLHLAGVRVLVPVTLPDRDLDWRVWTPPEGGREAPAALLGRAAVSAADLVLAPALAVAADGTRLGRGGGSYDRALRRLGPDTEIAALVFGDEFVPSLPHDPWDVPVTAVVTPTGWTRVGRNTGVGLGD